MITVYEADEYKNLNVVKEEPKQEEKGKKDGKTSK